MIPQYPKIMPMPMAQNGNKNDIPLTTETAGLFTYNEGFPPITQVSVKAGGKAPQRNDFNGAFYALSQHLFFLQAGGQYQWNAELDYNTGAVIQGSDGNQYLALQVSGPSSIGAKDPTVPENTAYWKKTAVDLVQTIRESSEASTTQAPSEQAVAVELEAIDTQIEQNTERLATLTDVYISGIGMPSDEYISYTPTVNALADITAPANGYFFIRGRPVDVTTNTGYLALIKVVDELSDIRMGIRVQLLLPIDTFLYLPVKKGDVIQYCIGNPDPSVPTNLNQKALYFVYAQGEV